MKIISKILSTIFDPLSAIGMLDTKKINNFFKKYPIFIYILSIIVVILGMVLYYI